MHTVPQKNKTLAAWLAFIGGQLGLHRLYLYGWRDLWAWAHPVVAALGWWGVERVRMYGQDDHLAWVLIPLLGFTLAGTALTGIYYGLMAPEKWNALHNPAAPDAVAGNTNWLTIGAVVFALLFGTIALMSSIAVQLPALFRIPGRRGEKNQPVTCRHPKQINAPDRRRLLLAAWRVLPG